MLDNKNDFAEACPVSIVQGKINDGVAMLVHGGDLLKAAETAAHAGGQNDKSGFFHTVSLHHILM